MFCIFDDKLKPLTLKSIFYSLLFAAIALLVVTPSCKKDDDNGKKDKGDMWGLTAEVDLSGVFTLIAPAEITVSGSSFTTAITTSEIGAAPEVHQFTITGAADGIFTLTGVKR